MLRDDMKNWDAVGENVIEKNAANKGDADYKWEDD